MRKLPHCIHNILWTFYIHFILKKDDFSTLKGEDWHRGTTVYQLIDYNMLINSAIRYLSCIWGGLFNQWMEIGKLGTIDSIS